jgi:hypothetical protein
VRIACVDGKSRRVRCRYKCGTILRATSVIGGGGGGVVTAVKACCCGWVRDGSITASVREVATSGVVSIGFGLANGLRAWMLGHTSLRCASGDSVHQNGRMALRNGARGSCLLQLSNGREKRDNPSSG